MNLFKLDNRTLQLLNAQVNLSETFVHTIRSAPKREAMTFRLKVDRGQTDTLFTVELGSERHTLTLDNGPKTHLKLADFIEEIANGTSDLGGVVDLNPLSHATRQYGVFDTAHQQQLFELVRRGGVLDLYMGFDLPIQVALHRCSTRHAVTTIMSIGKKRPRTKCFTLSGTEIEMYQKLVESIQHLAEVATPAAHAA